MQEGGFKMENEEKITEEEENEALQFIAPLWQEQRRRVKLPWEESV